MTFVANLNRSAKDYCNDINPGATMEEYAKHLADKKGYSVVVYEDYGDIGMLITMQCNNIMVHCLFIKVINGFCLTRLRKPRTAPARFVLRNLHR